MTIMVGGIVTGRHGAGAVAKILPPDPQVERKLDCTWYELLKPQSPLLVHTPSNNATPPNPSQSVPLTGTKHSNI